MRHTVPVLVFSLVSTACSSTHSTLDAPRPADAVSQDGAAVSVVCAPDDARLDPCGTTCRAVLGALWDGVECVPYCEECVGPACGRYRTVEACQAAHSMCEASLCTSTGGEWFRSPRYCDHHVCGAPPASSCESPVSTCNCGEGRVFDAMRGCIASRCAEVDPQPPEELCPATGGRWTPGICGSTTCGRFSELDCAAPGCVCGADEVFDAVHGCVPSARCDVAEIDESCARAGVVCGRGAICCRGGIPGADRCRAPSCEDPTQPCGPPRP